MPPRLTANDFDQELLILFDAYVHGDLDRRSFLNQAKKFAKAGVAATAMTATAARAMRDFIDISCASPALRNRTRAGIFPLKVPSMLRSDRVHNAALHHLTTI